MTDEQPGATVALSPVAAYPRRALEQYLEDARRSEAELRDRLLADRARLDAARRAIAACAEGHRLLGSMMVAAQQDLAARRRHAEAAAAAMVRDADAEAERILAAARTDAAALLGGVGVSLPEGTDDDQPGSAPHEPLPPVEASDPEPSTRPQGAHGAATVAALAAALPALALGRRTGRGGTHGPRWRSWRSTEPFDWPFNPAHRDEDYFSRLRDELQAEGALGAWFETA